MGTLKISRRIRFLINCGNLSGSPCLARSFSSSTALATHIIIVLWTILERYSWEYMCNYICNYMYCRARVMTLFKSGKPLVAQSSLVGWSQHHLPNRTTGSLRATRELPETTYPSRGSLPYSLYSTCIYTYAAIQYCRSLICCVLFQ